MVSKRIGAQKKPQGSPKGGRKLDLSQGDNRTVIELSEKIEAYRRRWFVVNANPSEGIPKGIDKVATACIALEDFAPDSSIRRQRRKLPSERGVGKTRKPALRYAPYSIVSLKIGALSPTAGERKDTGCTN
jgi:hypothetical protein